MMSSATKSIVIPTQSNLLSTEAAAAYLGVKPGSLEVWRCVGRYSIPYIKVGRLVKYRRADLDAWLATRIVGEPING